MKLLVINNGGAEIEVMADSALTLPGRPTFIPDLPQVSRWRLQPLMAVKVSRLGKCVSLKFAGRYFDAFTMAFRLVPCNSDGEPLRGIASVIDFGLTIGEWQPICNEKLMCRFDQAVCEVELIERTAAETVANVSQLATLKIGDVLLIPADAQWCEAELGSTHTAVAGQTTVLEMKLR